MQSSPVPRRKSDPGSGVSASATTVAAWFIVPLALPALALLPRLPANGKYPVFAEAISRRPPIPPDRTLRSLLLTSATASPRSELPFHELPEFSGLASERAPSPDRVILFALLAVRPPKPDLNWPPLRSVKVPFAFTPVPIPAWLELMLRLATTFEPLVSEPKESAKADGITTRAVHKANDATTAFFIFPPIFRSWNLTPPQLPTSPRPQDTSLYSVVHFLMSK